MWVSEIIYGEIQVETDDHLWAWLTPHVFRRDVDLANNRLAGYFEFYYLLFLRSKIFGSVDDALGLAIFVTQDQFLIDLYL